jgi:hypothetical protein
MVRLSERRRKQRSGHVVYLVSCPQLYPLHAAEVNALFWTEPEGKAKKSPLTG